MHRACRSCGSGKSWKVAPDFAQVSVACSHTSSLLCSIGSLPRGFRSNCEAGHLIPDEVFFGGLKPANHFLESLAINLPNIPINNLELASI